MASIKENKYSYEYAPKTSLLSKPTDHQKQTIQDAEDGPLAKFYDYDEAGNYFEFNEQEYREHKKDISDWVKKHPEFEVIKGTFEAMYGDKDNYDPEYIKHPNDKYIYLVTSFTDFIDDLDTKPDTYEPKDNEVVVITSDLKEAWNVKSPLDYIEDKLKENGIEYTVEQAVGDEPYDTWITINDGQDSLADEIICGVVGYAYEWVRDKYGNRKYCKVVTDEDTINELNESLKGNHSFKGLTKKVVEAKETCSQDYLRYKKQLQKAKSIDELRKVWQTIKKDYDADVTPEEDKHLANLFLDRKKELKENLKESWIQFTFEDGSNPYVAKTKEEQDRMFKKYKGRVEQVGDITYLVKSEKKKTNEGLDDYANRWEKKARDQAQGITKTTKYYVDGYYDSKYRGLANSEVFDDPDRAMEYVWELLQKGNYVKVNGNHLLNPYDVEEPEDIPVEWFMENLQEDKQVTYVWKKDGDDHILTKKGNNKALITLSRMNSSFPWTIYKGNKEITLDNDSDKLSDIKAYILKNVDKILGNKLKEDKSVEDWLKPLFLCDTLEKQPFISFAYHDQDDSVVATTSWETTPRKAHSDYIKTRELLGDRYNINVLRQENRDGNKEFAYVMRITPKGKYDNISESGKNANNLENRIKERTDNFTKAFSGNIVVNENELESAKDILSKHYVDVEYVKLNPGDYAYLPHPSGKSIVQYEIYGDTLKNKVNEADDRYFSTKPKNDIKIKKFVREYADEIKDDIDNDMYDEYGMWSKYLDMFITDFPKNKLTTSEFAIKFFDEINKRFGSNFHYGYLKEDKDITTDWFVKNDIDNCYYNHKGDRIFETDQELNGRWVFVPKDAPSKRKVFKTLDDAMKYAKNLEEDLDTFGDKMDFLAKDEDEAIDGYKKVIKTVDNKNVKTQLKKIETEEKAHKDYLERVKKNKNIKYTEPLDEE